MELNSHNFNRLKAEYPYLSRTFNRYWDVPLASYASNLYSKVPLILEPELKQSLIEELSSMGLSSETASLAASQLENKPVLQTSHHITPTNGPTFLALDIMSLAALKDDELYLVGANSGVAFSNSAWSGALSYGDFPLEQLLKPGSSAFRQAEKAGRERKKHGAVENRISLIPSRQRDQIVYGAQITTFQTELFQQFSPSLKEFLPVADPGSLYSHWAALTCARIQEKVLRRPGIVIFDINRVIRRYLIKVFSSASEHPVERMFFSSSLQNSVNKVFERPVMFLSSFAGKKSLKTDSLFWEKEGLRSVKTGFRAYDKQDLIQALEEEKLCPGVFLLFFILRFLNGVRCLGSFRQIEYLENFRQKWERLDIGCPLNLEPDYSQMLTTGRILDDNSPCLPLDLAFNDRTLDIESFRDKKMAFFWRPIVSQLT